MSASFANTRFLWLPRFNAITRHLPAVRGLSIAREFYRRFVPAGSRFHISDFDGDLHLDVDIRDHFGVLLWHTPELFEKEERALFCSAIHPGSVVLDVGANIGAFSLLAAKRGAQVFAVEADPTNAELLKKHVVMNRFSDRVNILEMAATDEPRSLTIYRNPKNIGNSNIFSGESPVSVEGATIDSLSLPPIDVCKMDIEGAEFPALLGMTETLKRSPGMKLLIEYFGERQSSGELLAFLRSHFRHIEVVGEGILSGAPPKMSNLWCSN